MASEEKAAAKAAEKQEKAAAKAATFSGIGGSQAIREHLAKQEVVTVLLEKREGEFGELPVVINDCKFLIKRGEPCQVPKQVAEMVYERMAAEGRLAQVSQEMMSRLDQGGFAQAKS